MANSRTDYCANGRGEDEEGGGMRRVLYLIHSYLLLAIMSRPQHQIPPPPSVHY